MNIADRIKTTIGLDEERAFKYECAICYATFDSPEKDNSLVSCPSCGADKVRAK